MAIAVREAPSRAAPRGLDEGEAAARLGQGHGNDAHLQHSQSYLHILARNSLTFLNGVLFSIGVALLALGRINDAITTVGVMVLNLLVGTVQELYAKRKLDRIALLSRPTATVLREGRERIVAPGEIVLGDLVVARAGDQIVADGRIVGDGRLDVDESLLTGESDLVPKVAGDAVYSGSICMGGRACYEATQVGAASLANQLTAGARAFRLAKTPLQRDIDLVIRIVLLVVFQLGLLLAAGAHLRHTSLVEGVQIVAVVAGLVPNGLILVITTAYALGALRMAGKGAVLQRANAVESLSHVDILCLDKTGTLTANRLALHAVRPLTVSEGELRARLADYAANVTAGNRTIAAIAAASDRRHAGRVRAEVPFSSARRWSALALEQGCVLVLGAPEVLAHALHAPEQVDEELRTQVATWTAQGLRVLLLASRPGIDPLYGADGTPQLPDGLVPLGLVAISDELRPEAAQTLRGFAAAAVTIKIISGDDPQTVAALARQAGLPPDLRIVSGAELEGLDDARLAPLARAGAIFGRITPQQKVQLVRVLRNDGGYVAMIGDGVNDVLALKEANLGIAMQSGSPATRGVADLVLLDDSFAALLPAVREGQRIITGMRHIVQLLLTRISSQALVILAVALLAVPFPFIPTHTSLLTFLTVAVPTFALAVWARPAPPPVSPVRALSRFVLTASWTLALAGLAVYLPYFFVSADPAIARTALTLATILGGLLLIPFAQPPTRFWVGGDDLSGDWRPTLLALALLAACLGVMNTPTLREFFELAPLDLRDYLLIGGVVGAWCVALRQIWRIRLFDRFLDLDRTPRT
jgi:cation-transporting P-type ATPase E